MQELFVGFCGQTQYTFTIWSLFTIILSFEDLCHNLNCNILFYAFIFPNEEFLPNKNQKIYDKKKQTSAQWQNTWETKNVYAFESKQIRFTFFLQSADIVCLRMKCISLESVFKMYSMISFLLYFFEQMIRSLYYLLLLIIVVVFLCFSLHNMH